MASRTESSTRATRKAAPAKKTAAASRPKRRAAPAADVPEVAAEERGGAEGLLRAGLKALGNVRDDVVKRQTNMIEGLLGIKHIDPGAHARAFGGLEGFGFRKFEDVFDQRVATALQRLGLPSAEELQALRDEVARLRAEVERLQKKPPAKRGSSPQQR